MCRRFDDAVLFLMRLPYRHPTPRRQLACVHRQALGHEEALRGVDEGRGAGYALLWGGRLGFIHMSIKHGYTLIPFASMGIEDALWTLLRLPLQPLLRLVGEARPPIVFPVLLPNNTFEKQYFRFGPPVPTRQYDVRMYVCFLRLMFMARRVLSFRSKYRRPDHPSVITTPTTNQHRAPTRTWTTAARP